MRVVQVLSNLVSNALKYSAAGSPVDVRLNVQDGQATVDVADVGRGIPADQLERVFDKFHRVEDPMRMTTGGTGLGLYIARELATAMGATLGCRSTLGVGSVFSVSLPVVAAPAALVAGGAAELTDGAAVPRPRLVPPWEPLRATPGA
jgi:signal transduction histidine kinase